MALSLDLLGSCQLLGSKNQERFASKNFNLRFKDLKFLSESRGQKNAIAY